MGEIRVAVNVSARQLADPGLPGRLAAALERHRIDPSLIAIELTESAVMMNPEAAISVLTQLRDLGLSIAVDDFGTGYSSLSYLRRLPIDTLKIDRSFIKDLETNHSDAEIIRTIIAMANTLGMGVVAEGVETVAQAEFLRAASCTLAQGFLFSVPLPADELVDWWGARQLACAAS